MITAQEVAGLNPAEVTKKPFKILILKGFLIFRGIIGGIYYFYILLRTKIAYPQDVIKFLKLFDV